MNKISLLLLLFIFPLPFCKSQSIVPIDLGKFSNKKIVSSLTFINKGSKNKDKRGIIIGYSIVEEKRQISFTPDPNNQENFKVEKKILRIQSAMGEGGKDVYDSDNQFDRSAIVNLTMGAQDKIVNKVVKYEFDRKGNRTDGFKRDVEEKWIDNKIAGQVFRDYLNYRWSEILQLHVPKDMWVVGGTFKDEFSGGNATFLNEYIVKSINKEQIVLSIKGSVTPHSAKRPSIEEIKKSNWVERNGVNSYEGVISINPFNRLITNLNITNKKETLKFWEDSKNDETIVSEEEILIENHLEN